MINREQHFKQIYESSKDKVYRLCLGFTGDHADADDLFQEIIIKVWHNLKTFRGESNINTWIYRIATNTALLYLRKRKKTDQLRSTLASEDVINEAVEAGGPFNEQKINQLHLAISGLKEIDRIIISLLLEESSYAEISEVTGISISNVGVRINRIKKSLAKKMK